MSEVVLDVTYLFLREMWGSYLVGCDHRKKDFPYLKYVIDFGI